MCRHSTFHKANTTAQNVLTFFSYPLTKLLFSRSSSLPDTMGLHLHSRISLICRSCIDYLFSFHPDWRRTCNHKPSSNIQNCCGVLMCRSVLCESTIYDDKRAKSF